MSKEEKNNTGPSVERRGTSFHDAGEEQIIKVEDAINEAETLIGSLDKIKVDAMGGHEDVYKKAKWLWTLDKPTLSMYKTFGQHEAYNKKIIDVAEKLVDKELATMEKTLAKDILKGNENILKHKKSSENDLMVLNKLNPDKVEAVIGSNLEDLKKKLDDERKALEETNKEKEAQLANELNKYREPALERKEELDSFLNQYNSLYAETLSQGKGVAEEIKNFESAIGKLQNEGEIAVEYKKALEGELISLKDKLVRISKAEEKLKNKIEAVKNDASKIDAFLKRIDGIGKTPEQKKKMEKEKAEEAKNKKTTATTSKITNLSGTLGSAGLENSNLEGIEKGDEEIKISFPISQKDAVEFIYNNGHKIGLRAPKGKLNEVFRKSDEFKNLTALNSYRFNEAFKKYLENNIAHKDEIDRILNEFSDKFIS